MNINELNQYGDFAHPLEVLYKKTGNCSANGYLGEKLQDVSFDTEGRLEFSTHKEVDDVVVDSKGAVLSDSILVKQTQKGHSFTSCQLYSWDVSQNKYTFLAFDNEDSLNQFYSVIKRFDANLCDEDVSSLFQEMGLTFESVIQVLLNQERSPIEGMFEEQSSNTGGSFTM